MARSFTVTNLVNAVASAIIAETEADAVIARAASDLGIAATSWLALPVGFVDAIYSVIPTELVGVAGARESYFRPVAANNVQGAVGHLRGYGYANLANPNTVGGQGGVALLDSTGQVWEEKLSTGGGAFGNWQSAQSGTLGFANRAAGGTVITSLSRLTYTLAAVPGIAGPFWNAAPSQPFISSTAFGGFRLLQLFGTGPTFNADLSGFFGVFSTIAFPSLTPSANDISQVLFGADPGDANWQVMHRLQGSGGTTKIPTTLAKAADQLFILQIAADAATPEFRLRVDRIVGAGSIVNVANAVLSGANIPALNTALIPALFVASSAAAVNMFKHYSQLVLPYSYDLAGVPTP